MTLMLTLMLMPLAPAIPKLFLISSIPCKLFLMMLLPFIGSPLHLHVKSLSTVVLLIMDFCMIFLFVA